MPDDRLIHRRSGHGDRSTLLNDLEFRVWVQFMLSADDFGVMRFSAVTLQADNDHLAERPASTVMRALKAVLDRGLIRTFVHQKREYAYQPDWQDWQKVKYPRVTLEPRPPDDALEQCTPKTRKLFNLYPGGNSKNDFEESGQSSENISEMFVEGLSSTRAGAPAKRLTLTANADGKRSTQTANGHGERVPDNGPPFDVWLRELQVAYPAQATRSHLTGTAFIDALTHHEDGPEAGWALMQANLASQQRGYQWRVKRMIPRLDRWLREGLWLQQHDAHSPDELTSANAKTIAAMAEILAEDDE